MSSKLPTSASGVNGLKLAEARKFRAMPGGARDMATLGNFITARDGERYDSMAQGTVMVTVSHSNLQQKHVDLRWDMHATVLDVKIRLTKHCGTPAQDMRLILRDGEGRDLCAMDDDDRPLGFYSVQNGNDGSIEQLEYYCRFWFYGRVDAATILFRCIAGDCTCNQAYCCCFWGVCAIANEDPTTVLRGGVPGQGALNNVDE